MTGTRPELWITYGPSVDDEQTLRRVCEAGAQGVRLTFSYGTPELQCGRASRVKSIAKSLDRDVRVIADLPGEKCRLAKIGDAEAVEVAAGEPIELTSGESELDSEVPRLSLQDPQHLELFAPGYVVIEGDGALLLDVIAVSDVAVTCVPRSGGVLRPGRGLAIQGSGFRPHSMPDKDREDLGVLLQSPHFDAVAVSFVASADDVHEARGEMTEAPQLEVIAKIETALGLTNLQDIVSAADSVMAARGDLALTMPWTSLADGVKRIVDTAREGGTPWQLATQIAEGMERFAFPSRAEICDLSRWLDEGPAAVMLTYETAFGPRPVETVAAVTELIDARCGGRTG